MDRKKGIFGICYQIVLKIYKKLHLWKIPVPGRDRVRADLNQLYPGENTEERITEYYVTKLTMSVILLIAGICVAFLVVVAGRERDPIENGRMQREDYKSGEKDYIITAKLEDGEKFSFPIKVTPRKYEEQELEQMALTFREELSELILGENESLDRVVTNLELTEEYTGYPFWVEWRSDSPDVVDRDGVVHMREEDCMVHLNAELHYEEYCETADVTVTVKTKDILQQSEKELIEELLRSAQLTDPEKESFPLPKSVEGKKITWEVKNMIGFQVLGGTLLTAIAIFFFKDRDIHELVEKKKQEAKRKYPEIVQKLTLYMEAGLTVRAAFGRVAEDYEQARNCGAAKQAAYEELLMANRELRMGISESAAYENFGKRTGVREYIRLSTFLTQNVKKGSTQLLQQLREEAKTAEEMRMQNARKLSEEASTKLLLPMMLLLLMVMILIMYPAFSNVGV